MNDPKSMEFVCPNPRCKRRNDTTLLFPDVPYERVVYVQLNVEGQEIARRVLYRCRHCGWEFLVS